MVMSLSKLRELVMDREAWHAAGHGRKSRTWLSNWTDWTEHSLEGLMLKLKPPILWPPDVKNQLSGKDPDAGKDWRQEDKETTEDKLVGWHHWLNRHEFKQALGDGEGQANLEHWSPWDHKEWNMTERLNNNNVTFFSNLKIVPPNTDSIKSPGFQPSIFY